MPRGGKRPGAGAPRGNVNGMKHGMYSRKVYLAALILAAVPEFRALFLAMAATNKTQHRTSVHKAVTDASRMVLNDPELANSIKGIVAQRLRQTFLQIQEDTTSPPNS